MNYSIGDITSNQKRENSNGYHYNFQRAQSARKSSKE